MSRGGDKTRTLVRLKLDFLALPEELDVKDLINVCDNARLFCLQNRDCILFAQITSDREDEPATWPKPYFTTKVKSR